MLNWDSIRTMRRRSVDFATITLAAGISSTGDPALDRRLPVAEPYRISEATASAIQRTKQGGGRIVGVGTTVVRALEHATAQAGIVTAIDGIADQRVTQTSTLRIVDAIFSGTHERDSSHYQLLRAFVDDATLARVDAALEMSGYRTHEFGDSVLIERIDRSVMSAAHVERREDAAATAA
jgi:S-adenosylmethionine:tRNA ribosyltransferase-isomerase